MTTDMNTMVVTSQQLYSSRQATTEVVASNPMEWWEKIKARREELGMSQKQLANDIGVSQAAIGKIETGQVAMSRATAKIADRLGLKLAELGLEAHHIVPIAQGGDRGPDNMLALTPNQHRMLAKGEIPDFLRDPDYWARAVGIEGEIPLRAAAEGGPGTLIISKDPIGTVARPANLQGIREAYAVYIVGTSMEPEFEQGDEALVNPKLPPIPGATCIFYTNDPHDDRAMIKRLVKITTDEWVVRQWNPPEGQPSEFTLSRREWPECHRTVGKYSRR